MSVLLLLLTFLSLAESPSRVHLLTQRTVVPKPAISTTSSTVFHIYEGNNKAPLIKMYPGWQCKDGSDAKKHAKFIADQRDDSKLYLGMEDDPKKPGLGAVLNAIEFRPAKKGGMEAVFYGEYNGVRVPVDEKKLKQMETMPVEISFESVLDYTLYVVRTNFKMTLQLKDGALEMHKTKAEMTITYYSPAALAKLTDPQVFESKEIELPPLTAKRAPDNSTVKDLKILN